MSKQSLLTEIRNRMSGVSLVEWCKWDLVLKLVQTHIQDDPVPPVDPGTPPEPTVDKLPRRPTARTIQFRGVKLVDMSRSDLLRVATYVAMKHKKRADENLGMAWDPGLDLDIEDAETDLLKNPPVVGNEQVAQELRSAPDGNLVEIPDPGTPPDLRPDPPDADAPRSTEEIVQAYEKLRDRRGEKERLRSEEMRAYEKLSQRAAGVQERHKRYEYDIAFDLETLNQYAAKGWRVIDVSNGYFMEREVHDESVPPADSAPRTDHDS